MSLNRGGNFGVTGSLSSYQLINLGFKAEKRFSRAAHRAMKVAIDLQRAESGGSWWEEQTGEAMMAVVEAVK